MLLKEMTQLQCSDAFFMFYEVNKDVFITAGDDDPAAGCKQSSDLVEMLGLRQGH